MSDKSFVDTNVLMYAHDVSQGAKHQAARSLVKRLWTSGGGVISTQVLQEFCVNMQRKTARPLPLEELRGLIGDYLGWEVVVNEARSALEALSIASRYQLSFWDALIVAAALKSGAARILSEDFNAGQEIAGIKIENPFASLS